MTNDSPLAKRRNLSKTLAERKKAGTQAQRRRQKFDSYKETEGPRAGLTKDSGGAHSPSTTPPAVPKESGD